MKLNDGTEMTRKRFDFQRFYGFVSQGHNFHKLLLSTFQKYYILDDRGKVSVLW